VWPELLQTILDIFAPHGHPLRLMQRCPNGELILTGILSLCLSIQRRPMVAMSFEAAAANVHSGALCWPLSFSLSIRAVVFFLPLSRFD
jgi:hypothetical protein